MLAFRNEGKFDGGWEKLREEVFARQKAMDWIPADTQLTPRPAFIPPWSSIPESQRAFETRLMEVFAGFLEQADVQAGKVIDELERKGPRDNTIVVCIFGDNGAATAGANGTISEILFQNGIPSTIDQHLKALDELGGLDALGSSKADNMYYAGWAWAGNTPFQQKQANGHVGKKRRSAA